MPMRKFSQIFVYDENNKKDLNFEKAFKEKEEKEEKVKELTKEEIESLEVLPF